MDDLEMTWTGQWSVVLRVVAQAVLMIMMSCYSSHASGYVWVESLSLRDDM